MKNIYITLLVLMFTFPALGGDSVEWPFDQAEDVATLTTRQVLNEGLPILVAIHYADDDSWGFICGTTNKTEDLRLVSMQQIVDRDPTLYSIADLPPGWSARRETIESEWIRFKDE